MVDTLQTSVNAFFAPGIVGGWASANPFASLLPPGNGDLADARSGSWKVGATGAVIGNFGFGDSATGLFTNAHPGTGLVMKSTQSGPVRVGFVQRDQIALITAYLGGDTQAMFNGQ